MKDGEKYREIGKVYFNDKGEVDATKTKASQDFTLLGVTMNIAVDTGKGTFKLGNIDKLIIQIKAQREIIKTYI